jgi:branched-chain amino acid transport system ATP-binding protein
MLEIENLSAGYFGSKVLNGISLTAGEGTTLVAGANGAGKSTLIKSINGSLRPISGSISLDGKKIDRMNPHSIALMGIATVPERGRIFGSMSVEDNLRVSFESVRREKGSYEDSVENIYEIFSDLKEKRNDKAGTLSGGQQQMLSIGRAIITSPKLLLMDEPTTGLFPRTVRELVSKISEISQGMSLLLTEQNLAETLFLTRKVYILESGKIVFSGTPDDIRGNKDLRNIYLGTGGN